ncbi:MAG: cupin domain-containing protein [Pseudomonadota bacterium]
MTEASMYPWVDAGEGVRRRILAETPEAMTVEVEFAKGAVGDPHAHVHVQTIFVAAGQFEFTVDGVTMVVSAGDSLVIPSNAVHGCVCIENGKLIDSFTPRRDDFL